MKFADEGGEDVGGLEIVVVAGAVKIGGHGGDEVAVVLAAEGFAEFEAGDFGDGVPFVGGFKRAGEEGVFVDGLRRELGVDAGAAEEKEFADFVFVGAVDEMVLDEEILVKEGDGLGAVGEDAADFCGGDEDVFGLFAVVELADGFGVEEVEFGAGAGDEVGVAEVSELARDGAADESPVTGDIDAGVTCDCHIILA